MDNIQKGPQIFTVLLSCNPIQLKLRPLGKKQIKIIVPNRSLHFGVVISDFPIILCELATSKTLFAHKGNEKELHTDLGHWGKKINFPFTAGKSKRDYLDKYPATQYVKKYPGKNVEI